MRFYNSSISSFSCVVVFVVAAIGLDEKSLGLIPYSVLNARKALPLEACRSRISNAAYLSTWTNDRAEVSTDEALFEKYLNERRANEKCTKK